MKKTAAAVAAIAFVMPSLASAQSANPAHQPMPPGMHDKYEGQPSHGVSTHVQPMKEHWPHGRRMSLDVYTRWLSRATLAVAIIMIGWGLSVVLGQPVTAWFATSATIWMALLLISALWQLRGSFTAIAALALATGVVSRLFSILRLNPPASIAGLNAQDLDLLVATGPGVPGFELLGWFLGALVFVQFILRAASAAASADSRESSLNASAPMFIRVGDPADDGFSASGTSSKTEVSFALPGRLKRTLPATRP